MNHLIPLRPLRHGVLVLSLAAVAAWVWSRPKPSHVAAVAAPSPAHVDPWFADCERKFEDAKREVSARTHIRFERLVRDVHSPDPDALRFPHPDAVELQLDLAPFRGQRGSDMFIIDDEDRAKPGWLAEGYTEHGLTLWTYEAADASHFVKITITTLKADVAPWDSLQPELAATFERVGSACLASR